MLDRALKVIVTVTLLLFFVQAVIGVLARFLVSALHGFMAGIGALGGVVTGVVTVCFTVGLAARISHSFTARSPRTARERATRERAIRTRVRRPTEDVPAHELEETSADSDPALNEAADEC